MKKIINYLQHNKHIIIYIILFCFMIYRHINIPLGVGDDIWFLEKSKMDLFDYTLWRIETWTSRNIIEFVMLIMLNLSKWVWITLDSIMFVLILHSIRKIVCFKKNKDFLITILIALVIVCFPFNLFSEAGWYATTLNYVWPLAFGLYSLSYLMRIFVNEKVNIFQKIIMIIGLIYAINQEQMCALIFGFYTLFIVYNLINHHNIPKFVYVVVACTIVMLVYHAFCPGNAIRKVSETAAYYSEFKYFSVIDKLFLGVLTTISIVMINPFYIVFIWSLGLIYVIYFNSKNIKQYAMVILMTITMYIISISDKFLQYGTMSKIYNIFSTYLQPVKFIDYKDINIYLMMLYFCTIIIISLYIIKSNLGFKLFVIESIILAAAFCSRIILGFSASIFMSGSRTFVNSYFLIFIAVFIFINANKIKRIL